MIYMGGIYFTCDAKNEYDNDFYFLNILGEEELYVMRYILLCLQQLYMLSKKLTLRYYIGFEW